MFSPCIQSTRAQHSHINLLQSAKLFQFIFALACDLIQYEWRKSHFLIHKLCGTGPSAVWEESARERDREAKKNLYGILEKRACRVGIWMYVSVCDCGNLWSNPKVPIRAEKIHWYAYIQSFTIRFSAIKYMHANMCTSTGTYDTNASNTIIKVLLQTIFWIEHRSTSALCCGVFISTTFHLFPHWRAYEKIGLALFGKWRQYMATRSSANKLRRTKDTDAELLFHYGMLCCYVCMCYSLNNWKKSQANVSEMA